MKQLGLIFLLFFLKTNQVGASHLWSVDLKHTYLGNNKYLITGRVIRDCRGIALYSVDFGYFAGTNSSNGCGGAPLTIPRIKISDISTRCSKSGAPCFPQNTGSTGEGYEEHIYQDTIDFNESYFADLIAKKSCCEISFYMGLNGGLSGAYTTGMAGNGLYAITTINFSNLKKCKDQTNNSPDWRAHGALQLCCNQAANIDGGGYESGSDEVKYFLTPGINSLPNSSVTYASPFSYDYPVTPYCVPPTSIKCTPNIKTNPPRGFYLDSTSGLLIYTPTNCNEVALICLAAKEYRTDTSGKKVLIGKSVRAIGIAVKDDCGYNKTPYIENDLNNGIFHACVNQILSIPVQIRDETFTPYQTIPDTPVVTLVSGPPGAVLKMINTKIREKSASIFWKPQKNDVSTQPFIITLLVNDSHCPKPAFYYKNYQVYVHGNSDSLAILSGSPTRCDGVAMQLKSNVPKNYSLEYYLYDSATNYLLQKSTTGVFEYLTENKYKVSALMLKNDQCVQINKDHYFSIIKPTILLQIKDTTVCENLNMQLKATLLNPKPNQYKYLWTFLPNTIPQDTNASILLKNIKLNIAYKVSVSDSFGCTWTNPKFTFVYVNAAPKIDLGQDVSLCKGNSIKLNARADVPCTYIWNNGITKDTQTVSSGIYWVKATNINSGCYKMDTINISATNLPKFVTDNNLNLCASIADADARNFISEDSTKPAGPVTIKALSFNGKRNTTETTNFIPLNNSVIPKNTLAGIWKFGYQTQRNGCSVSDSFVVNISPNPIANFTIYPGTTVPFSNPVFRLTNTSTYTGSGLLNYKWNFGQNTYDTSVLKDPVIMYANPGNYTINLAVTNAWGCISQSKKPVKVSPGAIPAAIDDPGIEKIILLPDLKISNIEFRNVYLTLYDATGRKVLETQNNSGIGESNIASGIYFYRIQVIKTDGTILSYSGKTSL